MAESLRGQTDRLVSENDKDLRAAQENGLSSAMIDRLRLDADRVAKMAKAVIEIAEQPDPVGAGHRGVGAASMAFGSKSCGFL